MNTDNSTSDDDEITPEILNWCRNLVATLRHGGTWGIPRSGVVFKIDKERKRLVMTLGNESDEDFISTKRVFAKIGWDVVTEKEQ